MNRKLIWIVLFALLLGTSSLSHLDAAVEYQVDVSSRYIWRGFDLNPQNKPVLQPSVTFTLGDSGLSLNLWSSFSFVSKDLDEVDVTLSYDFQLSEGVAMTVGLIHYGWYFIDGFSFKDNTTQELYATVGFSRLPLAPELTVYYDFGNGDGLYLELGVSHSLRLSDELNLDLSASLGYNDKLWVAESGLSDLTFGASVPFKVGEITISPFLNMMFVLMDAVNPYIDNEIWGGASIVF
jgi:uncharacterized protein (TIGR02001 family)